MKRQFLQGLFFVSVVACASAFVHADELWENAIDAYERSKDNQPKVMHMRYEELKKDGSVDDVREIDSVFVKKENGQTDSEIIKVVHNGKDITEQEKKKSNDDKGKKQTFSLRGDLFAREKQDSVKYSRLEGSTLVAEKDCVVYAFEQKVSDTVNYKGRVWLDSTNGLPVKSEFTMNPLPSKVKKMDIVVHYMVNDGLFAFKTISFNVHASFLIISKRIRTFMEFGY